MSRADLSELLSGLVDHTTCGLDASVTPVPGAMAEFGHEVVSVASTDVFYPLVDNPYLQGWIACCNVLSDLYALGVSDITSMLIVLGVALEIPDADHRLAVARWMIAGYAAGARAAGTRVTGGQTLLNPWPLVGGSATALCVSGSPAAAASASGPRTLPSLQPYIAQDGLVLGDVLVLTKPLGTQIAVNLHQWLRTGHPLWTRVSQSPAAGGVGLTPSLAEQTYAQAVGLMMTLNRLAARLMHRHAAHCATDITGFGILGHADNLARTASENGPYREQLARSGAGPASPPGGDAGEAGADPATCAAAGLAASPAPVIGIELTSLPVLPHVLAVDTALRSGQQFWLKAGYSAETSGGLLIALPSLAAATALLADLRSESGIADGGWVVGRAVDARAYLATLVQPSSLDPGAVPPAPTPTSPHRSQVPLAWITPDADWPTATYSVPSTLAHLIA